MREVAVDSYVSNRSNRKSKISYFHEGLVGLIGLDYFCTIFNRDYPWEEPSNFEKRESLNVGAKWPKPSLKLAKTLLLP